MSYDCPNYVAPHRDQLRYAEGGKYGGVNCTPVSFARALDAGTCGQERFTGAQIRAASNEPIPDPKSPGLNLDQGDAAVFKLTTGDVNFDTRHGYDVDLAYHRIIDGQPAVIQYQRSKQIALGHGNGNRFPGGHAASVDSVNGLHLDDPLTSRFAITYAEFRQLCGSLVLTWSDGHTGPLGVGKAYVSFAPDVTHDWRIVLPGYSFFYYPVDEKTRTITGKRKVGDSGPGSSAPCSSPRRFTDPHGYTDGRSCSLVVVSKGFLKGYGVPSKYAQLAGG